MKILITGANGQLGSEFKKIAQKASQVFDFHDIDTLDLLDTQKLNQYFSKESPDIVVNCAAYTAVDKAEQEKDLAHKGNCTVVTNLVKVCRDFNCILIHISTDYVFDGTNYRPYLEDDDVRPQNEYGRTKLYGEQEALKFDKSMVIRTSWLYSSFGNNFVKTMIRLGKEKKELNVVSDQIGSPTFAGDLATAIFKIIKKIDKDSNAFVPGIYHFANEGVCSWYDLAWEIMKLKKFSCKVKPIETKEYPTPAKRPQYSVLNKRKICMTYKLEIPHWKESLKKCIRSL